MNPYLKQYRQTQIDTAPKEQILLMLYDGAVRFLNQAKAGFAEKNIEKIHNNIVKVQNIITEFESTLDMKTGGEFAQNLFALYEYINNQLLLANIKKREECLDEALKHITTTPECQLLSLMMKIMKMTTRWESIFNNEHRFR